MEGPLGSLPVSEPGVCCDTGLLCVGAAGAGAITIADAVVVVVRIFCVEDRSWRGARSVGYEWTKTAGGTRRVRDSGETKSGSRRRVAIAARALC